MYGRIHLHGPGTVHFGDDVVVLGRPTAWTHAPEAHIEIGHRVMLGDARFGCARHIRSRGSPAGSG